MWKNYYQSLKINNQALKINNQALKIYYQALKIVLLPVLHFFLSISKIFLSGWDCLFSVLADKASKCLRMLKNVIYGK